MDKQTFLARLDSGLSGLPPEDRRERLGFYGEMIDDRLEEGLSQEEAVAQIGSVEQIIAQTLAEVPTATGKQPSRRRVRGWEIVLLVLGSPLWLSLLISGFAVVIALYVVLWCIPVVLWAVEAALWGCSLGGLLSGCMLAYQGNIPGAAAMLGTGCFCAGASILLFFGCKAVTKAIAWLTKRSVLWIVHLFIRKERAL